MNSDELAHKQLSISGYPFQVGVQHLIEATRQQHGWDVLDGEYAWSRGDTSGYIDIALRHSAYRAVRMVIECKRMRGDDARALQWLFLVPSVASAQTNLFRCLTANVRLLGASRHYESNNIGGLVWDDVCFLPHSLESAFCVTYSDQPRQKPQVESICAELLASVRGLVSEEMKLDHLNKMTTFTGFYVPVIVTNVSLKACVFHPGAITLDTGVIPREQCTIEEVPYIRFRKSLTTEFPYAHLSDIRTLNKARERTVFIVNAGHLVEFLTECRITGPKDSFEGYAMMQTVDPN